MTQSHENIRKRTVFNENFCGFKFKKGVFAPGAKCPNHECRLYLTDQVGIGICELSGAHFSYEEGPKKVDEELNNNNREFQIRIINGKPQKVFRMAPGWGEVKSKLERK